MAKYNLNQLVKIQIYDFEISKKYFYLEEKRFLGIRMQKKGVYLKFAGRYIFGSDDIPNCFILKDGIIYEKPCAIMRFNGGYKAAKTFESFLEAAQFQKEITTNKVGFINL